MRCLLEATREMNPALLKQNLVNTQRRESSSVALLLAISVALVILENDNLLLLHLLLHRANHFRVLHVRMADERLVFAPQQQYLAVTQQTQRYVVQNDLLSNVVVQFVCEKEIVLRITPPQRPHLADFILCSRELHHREPVVVSYSHWLVFLCVLKNKGVLLHREALDSPVTCWNLLWARGGATSFTGSSCFGCSSATVSEGASAASAKGRAKRRVGAAATHFLRSCIPSLSTGLRTETVARSIT